MSRLEEGRKKVIGCIIVAIALLFTGNWLYKNQKVHFEDDKMRQIICLELGEDKDYKGLTYEDLDKIKKLDIGPVGEYETIIDVAKLKNLKQLRVNVEITYRDTFYELFQKNEDGSMYYPPVDKEKIVKVQEELGKILKKSKKLELFGFTNVNESCNITNFEFLKYAKNLKRIDIAFGNIEDYSVLENCKELERVDLCECNIETVDSLLKLKNVNKFWLTGTPLAENEKEIKRLKEAFPEAEIIID